MNCPPGTNCVLGRVICPFVPPCFTRQTECVPFGGPQTFASAAAVAPKLETCATKKCPAGEECLQINCIKFPCPEPAVSCIKKEPKLPLCSQFHCAKGTRCLVRCQPDEESTTTATTTEAYNPCAATTCLVGSECRVKQVVCKRPPCDPIGECYTPPQDNKCGAFETFKDCSSRCEPSCANKTPICILLCGPPKCQCNVGFFRDANGRCVTENECDSITETNPY